VDDTKLRRMVEGGYSQVGIAALLGVDIGTARRLVRSLRNPEDKPKPRTTYQAQGPTDFQLRELPARPLHLQRRPRSVPRTVRNTRVAHHDPTFTSIKSFYAIDCNIITDGCVHSPYGL
jgi:hypothetical protein